MFPPLKVLQEFAYPVPQPVWWPKFDVDPQVRHLAVGARGVVYVFAMARGGNPQRIEVPDGDPLVLTVAFSPDGRTLLAATDCGQVLRYRWPPRDDEAAAPAPASVAAAPASVAASAAAAAGAIPAQEPSV
jgi:hypothetical protein